MSRDPFLDQAPVGFDLGFAGTAEKAKPAPLSFEVCPGTHKSALLIGKMCELDLQRALARASAAAEDFQDQAGTVEHLGAPCPFQVALLHRGKRAVHHDNAGIFTLDQSGDLLDFSLPDECRRADVAERDDAGRHHVEIDGASKANGFFKPRSRYVQPAWLCVPRRGPAAQMRFNDERAARLGAGARTQPIASACRTGVGSN